MAQNQRLCLMGEGNGYLIRWWFHTPAPTLPWDMARPFAVCRACGHRGQDSFLTLINGCCRPPWCHFQDLQPEAPLGKGKAEFIRVVERRLRGHSPCLWRGLQSALIYLVGRHLAGLLLWLQDAVLRSGNHSSGD